MNSSLAVAYPRFHELEKHLGLSLIEGFNKELDSKNTSKLDDYELFYQYAINGKDFGVHGELFEEVLAIEYEKLKLKDSLETIRKISKHEKEWNKKRDEIFGLSSTDFMALTLTASPLSQTYESYWEIISVYPSSSYVTSNLSKEKNDYYFLFQRIGVLDRLSQNNIIEYPLNSFEYATFELFEKSKDVGSALNDFSVLFDHSTEGDFKEIEKNFIRIVKNAVFRKFLITIEEHILFSEDFL